MNKFDVWKKVKQLDIAVPFQETIFKLIDENIERVEFVKDHIGLRDFLFIAEINTTYYDELFLFIDADASKETTLEENERRIMEKYEAHPFDIISHLRSFFETETRVLSIGIGFSNTEPTDEEIEFIESGNKNANAKIEAYRNLRINKFPLWYQNNAKMPTEVTFFTLDEERHMAHEKQVLDKEKLIYSINRALEDNDLESFLRYSNEYIANYV